MRRAAVVIVALATAMAMGTVAAACSSSDDGSSDSSAKGSGDSDTGFHATLGRSTLYETHRALSLQLRSDQDAEVHLGTIQLDSPLFAPADPDDRDARLDPGRTTGLPLPFGTADCDGEADGPAELVADIDGDEVRIPIDESPPDVLATLHRDECAEADVYDRLDLRIDDGWEQTGPRRIEGDVVMAQREDGVTATLRGMTGNVLYTVADDAPDEHATWLAVDDDHPSVRGHLTIQISRCDPHGLIEFKKPFVLMGFVALGDADPVRIDIEAQGEARRLMGHIRSGCLAS
jgi:hypothetical protein